MKLGVILHGAKSNRHAQRKEIEKIFSDWNLHIRVTEYDRHAEKIARELCDESCDVSFEKSANTFGHLAFGDR
jgi:diacylglycerol kinase family enzyme